MAKEGRDEKGRFVKGGKNNPGRRFTDRNATEMAQRSADVRREKRTVAESLRIAMYEPDPDNPGRTMLDSITGGAISQMIKNKNIAEVRVLADVLGELSQKVDVNGQIDLNFKFGGE